MKSRKVSWMREEVILALELYLERNMATRADWGALSDFLRRLPVEQHLAEDPKFRNWQGVRNKLYNLQSLDTGGHRGRPNAGAATVSTWAEFERDLGRVRAAAAEVRTGFADLVAQNGPEMQTVEFEYEADESGVVMRTHRSRERDQRLVKRKREAAATLACEACGFDSEASYGISGIIECHHLKPVSDLVPGETTRLADLRLVCPNCHRLIHRTRPWLEWDQLLALVSSAG